MLDHRLLVRPVALLAVLVLCSAHADAGPGTRSYSEIGDPAGLENSRYGSAVVVQSSTVHVGAPQAGGTGRVLTYSRFDGERRLYDSYAPAELPTGARFGESLAVAENRFGDDDVVAGAPGIRAAFVLSGLGNASRVDAFRIDGPTGVQDDGFGSAVALAEDCALVGAALGEGAGRVHTYTRGPRDVDGNDTWLAGAVLSGPDAAGASFGESLAATSDTLVVGAPGESVDGVEGAGAIYIFTREPFEDDAEWQFDRRIASPQVIERVRFGRGIDIRGDRIVVSAPHYVDGGIEHAGAFWTFVRDESGNWSQEDFETDPTPAFKDTFGWVLRLGPHELYVSAGGDRVERFLVGEDGFTHDSTLSAPDGDDADFGASLAITGPHVLIGAPLENATGELYAMTPVTPLDLPAAQLGGRLGWDVAVSGDVAVVTAPFTDGSAGGAGLAHVLRRDEQGRWELSESLTRDTSDANEELGFSVAIAGPVMAVSVKGLRDDRGVAVGGAVVYRPDESGWVEETVLRGEGVDGGSQFGYSIDTDGRTIVVGARDHTAGADRSGAAFVFERVEGEWMQVAELRMPLPSAGAYFGRSVGVEGDWIVVGAPRAGVDGVPTGAAYTFERTESGWESRQTLVARAAAASSSCGEDVAIGGGRILLSARTAFAPQLSWGAFGFYLDDGNWEAVYEPIHEPGRGVTITGLDIEADAAAVGVRSGAGNQIWLCRASRFSSAFERRVTIEAPGSSGPVNAFGESIGLSCNTVVMGDATAGDTAGAAFVVSDVLDGLARIDIDGPRTYRLLVDEPVDIQLDVSGGAPPYAFETSSLSALPAGLTLDAESGRLFGTPTAPSEDGRSSRIEVTDVCGRFASVNVFAVPRLSIPDDIVLPAVVGRSFSQFLSARSGVDPTTFEIIAGGFAPGLELSEDGRRLTGTPTSQGRFQVTLRGTDGSGDVVERTIEHVCTAPLDLSAGRSKSRFDYSPSDVSTPRTVVQTLELLEGTDVDVIVKTARGETLPATLTVLDNRGSESRFSDDVLTLSPRKGRIRLKRWRVHDTNRYTVRVDVDPDYTGSMTLVIKVRLDREAYDSTRYISGTGTLPVWVPAGARLDVSVKPIAGKKRESDRNYVDDPVVTHITTDDGLDLLEGARTNVKRSRRRYTSTAASDGGLVEIELASAGDPEAIGELDVRVRIKGAKRYRFALSELPVGVGSPGDD